MADTLKQSLLKALGRPTGDRFTNLSKHEPDELSLQLHDMNCDHASAILGRVHRAIDGKSDPTATINRLYRHGPYPVVEPRFLVEPRLKLATTT